MRSKHLLPALVMLLTIACSPKNPGYITLVNSDVDTLKISIDGRSFTLKPTNHITKEIEAGMHQVKIGDQIPTLMNVQRGMTTVFDSTGLSCFVVGDFTDIYKGGPVKIGEKFFHQKVFTPSLPMSAMLGAETPLKQKVGDKILQIRQIDCDIIDDEAALLKALSP